MRSRLLGPDGQPLGPPPTLLDAVREDIPDLVPIVEVLATRNRFLQDKPWQARVSPILDHRGREILVEIK